ncbi:MAG: LamG-like jellyroll fold domain-containing protein, partial [Bacteroidota bacterium]|nr:LamG-like jellyroll fold domain-containing protein [Bacteroidota bacterium]
MKKYTLSNIRYFLSLLVFIYGLTYAQPKCMKVGMNNWFFAYWVPDFPMSNDFHKDGFRSTGASWDTGLWQYFPKDSAGYPLQVPYNPPQDNPDAGPQIVGKIILWQGSQRVLPNGPSAANEYVVLFDGDGDLTFGEATSVKTSTFYTDGTGKRIGGRYTIQWNNAAGWDMGGLYITRSTLGNHVRNIRVLMPGTEATYQTNFVNPKYATAFSPFYLNRFMDWGGTNSSPLVNWSDRPHIYDENWTTGKGIPYEAMIKYSNNMKKHAWVCVPHLASDDFIDKMAKLWHDSLDTDLKVYVEFSNEMWNDGFTQAQYMKGLGPNYGEAETAAKMINAWQRWRKAWGKDSLRVNRVIASQAAQLPWMNRWVSHMKPGDFDYIATSWYHGVSGGTIAQAYTNSVNDWRNQQSVWHRQYANLARQFNAKLCTYEGGGSIVEANNSIGRAFEQSPQYQLLEQEVIDTLKKIGYDFINHYTFMGTFSNNGTYGILEHGYQDPATNNKYQIIAANSTPCYVVTVTTDTIASGLAVKFDGNNDRIEANTISKPNGFTDDFTYEIWVKPYYTSQDQVLFSAKNTVSGMQMSLKINYQNLVLFEIGSAVSLYSSVPVKSNEWQHIAVSKLGTDYRLFINGVERGYVSASGSGTFGFNTFILGAANGNVNGYSGNYSGQIDEFKYWNTAISSISTLRNYMCKKTTSMHPNYANLLAYFRFDIVSGNIVDNRIGSADGILMNFTNVEDPAYTASGAPIGDESVYIYNSATLSFVHPQGDQFSVIGQLPAQLTDGIHIYITNRTPTGISIPNGFNSYSGARYFGAFYTNSNTEYNVYYSYLGNPGAIGANESMRLLKRNDNSTKPWRNGVSFLDNATRTLKIECREKYRGEYILGIRGAAVTTKKSGAGNAVRFVASSPVKSIEVPVQLKNDFTITTWFKGVGRLFFLTNSTNGYTWLAAEPGYFGGTNQIAFTGVKSAGGWDKLPDGGTTNWNVNEGCPGGDCPEIYPNDWNHIAYVFNKSANTVQAFVNGIPHATGTINSFVTQDWNQIVIGGSNWGAGDFVGDVDEFSVFDTQLTQTEIRDWMCKVMNKTHPKYCKNLVAYFNFDEDGNPSTFEHVFGSSDAVVNSGTLQMVRSGAKVGDVSVNSYASPTSISLSSPEGDVFSVSGFNPFSKHVGVHLYRVNGNMKPSTPLPGGFTGYDSTRYWGIFISPTVNTQWPDNISQVNFNAIYNFANNSSVAIPANTRLAARKDNSVTTLLSTLGTPVGSVVSLAGMNMFPSSGVEFLLIGNSFQSARPAIPSVITGPSTVCKGQKSVLYVVDTVPNVSYLWRFPSGFSFSSSKRTVLVDVSTAAVSGVISVTALNIYGQSPARTLNVTVNNSINPDILVLGSQVCANANGIITIQNAENAVTYRALLGTTVVGGPSVGTGSDLVINIPNANLNKLNPNVFVISASSGICNIGLNNNPVISTQPLTGLISDVTTICSSNVGLSTLYNSELNVIYFITNNSGTTTLAGPFMGGGNLLLTLSGNYLSTSGINTFKIQAVKQGCTAMNMANDLTFIVKPSPLEKNITPLTGTVCAGSSPASVVTIRVSNSEPGVIYYAELGGISVAQDNNNRQANYIITGNGANMDIGFTINPFATIPYGMQSWNVVAVKNGCEITMKDTATVFFLWRNSLPSNDVNPNFVDGTWGFNQLIASGGSFCNVTTPSSIRLGSVQPGHLFQVHINNQPASGWHWVDNFGDQIVFNDLDMTKFTPGSNTVRIMVRSCNQTAYSTQSATVNFSSSTGPNRSLAVSDALICQGGNGTITIGSSQSGITYTAFLDQNGTQISTGNGGNNGNLNIILTGAGLNIGTYTATIRAKDATCPAVELTDKAMITVSSCNFAPVANFTVSSNSFCVNTTISANNLSTGTITSFNWNFGSGSNPISSISSIPGAILYTTTGVKTIFLTVTGPGGTNVYSQIITVTGGLTINISGPSTLCGGSVSLTASGANTYNWMPGNLSGAIQSLSPGSTTTYSVSGINASGCSGVGYYTLTF